MPACLLILTLDPAVTQYGQLLLGIFNLLIVTGRLSIVSNHIDNVSKLLNILLTEDLRIHHVPVSHYTASMISPPCGDCTYLPICLHKDEEKEEKEDCWDKLIIQGR